MNDTTIYQALAEQDRLVREARDNADAQADESAWRALDKNQRHTP